ncbi:hypothetical protein AYO44_10465 [Planctomycetaceae bacterium SCGC AG-212-F19]|nr:hypothetical protein AYO44_10465 [Planctomycetaceae bacterium SCGC AG-212-F19]
MKCLSLIQPWASLIVLGAKQYETRRWHTTYRGRIAIHASRKFPETARHLCRVEPFRAALKLAGLKHSADLPCGVILGSVELMNCLPAADVRMTLSEDAPELAFADFADDPWAWWLVRPILLAKPIPLAGRLGLFDIPDLSCYQHS